MGKLLAIVTSVGEYDKVGFRTGLWLGELTHFLDAAEEAGHSVDIASPLGGYVPIDPESLMMQEMGAAVGLKSAVHKRYQDRVFMNRLQDSLKIADLNAEAYDAIYLTGGHGVMFDFSDNDLASLVTSFYQEGKVVSAVCHGPCGLLEATLEDGEHLLKGKKVTGFSWAEEKAAKRDHAVPFNLQEELEKRGASYEKALIPFASHVVKDGLLITGQNPASASGVGQAVVKALAEQAHPAARA